MIETPLYDLLKSQWHYNGLNHSNLNRAQRRIHDDIWRGHCDKQRRVEKMFGALNGWSLTETAFSPDAIGKHRSNWNINNFEWNRSLDLLPRQAEAAKRRHRRPAICRRDRRRPSQ